MGDNPMKVQNQGQLPQVFSSGIQHIGHCIGRAVSSTINFLSPLGELATKVSDLATRKVPDSNLTAENLVALKATMAKASNPTVGTIDRTQFSKELKKGISSSVVFRQQSVIHLSPKFATLSPEKQEKTLVLIHLSRPVHAYAPAKYLPLSPGQEEPLLALIKLCPNKTEYHIEYVKVLAENGRGEEALAHIEGLKQKSPTWTNLHRALDEEMRQGGSNYINRLPKDQR